MASFGVHPFPMAEVHARNRIYLRCSNDEKAVFEAAADRRGLTLTQFILSLVRVASRTAVSTMRSINSSALVR